MLVVLRKPVIRIDIDKVAIECLARVLEAVQAGPSGLAFLLKVPTARGILTFTASSDSVLRPLWKLGNKVNRIDINPKAKVKPPGAVLLDNKGTRT